ncbi:MAG: hypothetical protein CVV23_04595 [Ignavibacteriae bacterium HGW-Ignavibacteriae-2]|nr:MAG: hypothetical protein CVV23_04595 [Ignavibacteriae bacterium HGW-Ignavibacteriae-2]
MEQNFKATFENSFKWENLEFFLKEIPLAIKQSEIGIRRVSKIIKAMKDIAHPGVKEKTYTDINNSIEVSITIPKNEWKYLADLELDLDPDLPPLLCLQEEINQVLLNTIVNAANAIEQRNGLNSPEKGNIIIKSCRENNDILIKISDTGTAIKKEFNKKIFDPFYKTKPVGKGTGQGLSIVQNIIVEKHNGLIEVETKLNEETTFIYKLPLS